MSESWQLFWTTTTFLAGLAFLIYAIVGITRKVGWHACVIRLILAAAVLVFSMGAENGGGIYARAFYSKEVRAAWISDLALQEKLIKSTTYTRMSLACPKKEVQGGWDEAAKAIWRDRQLRDGRTLIFEECYIRELYK